jgi:hypothetical protein
VKFIAILSVGLALSLSGCGSYDDEAPPPFPNAVAPVQTTASAASDTQEEETDSSSDLNSSQYEGTSVEGMSVEPAVNPSVSSEASSEAPADDQSAEQASDESDRQ